MSTEALTDEVKTRVPQALKGQLSKIAEGRHIKLSDVVREALRDYSAAHPVAETKSEGKQEAA